MDNIYGINVTNKFALFYNEDIDPLQILAKKEKKPKDKTNVDQEKKKKDDKSKKDKNTKKTVEKKENKNKPVEEVIKPEKEEKANAPRQNDRPRTARQNFNKEDNRPPRRRDGNNQENRNFQERPERQDRFEKSERPERFDSAGFSRPDRLEGGQREGGERGFGRGRGGRGGRGRGGRGGRGGGFGKREFERHSGSDRTSGVKATDKREGGGSHNWGTVKDDIDLPPKVDYWRDPKEQMKETTEETTQDWNQTNEDTENKDPNESTESAPVEGEQEDQPKQMTLDEWKKLEESKRMKSQFKLRKANEGVDMSQWKNARMYRKSEGDDSDEEEEDEDDEDVLPGSSKATKETESLQDRIASQRAIIAAFISEHCLPFSMAEDLLKLGKRLSEDKPALEKTTISRSSATYINTHGLAKNFKDELKQKVKGKMLSLNLDEATNNNNDKILNILIQYYDDDENQIALRHLGSCKQNRATASDIMQSIETILSDYEISWNQVISILMDNCSTMRGVRGGVEALAREKNPNLLDVSGDSVHMINNVAKVLLSHVNENIQPFCMDMYYDIEESPKVREIFNEIQTLMNISSPKHLVRPISSRFLQMQDVCSRFMELLDPLTIYYYSFLSEEEKTRYRGVVSQILTERSVSDEAQAAILLIQMGQEKQQKSLTSTERKQRVIKSLFENRRETIISVNTFRGLLDMFQGYVKSFQSEKPLIHQLHRKMLSVTQEVLGMFIKPEHIPDRVSELIKLDISDRNKQKLDKYLGVGKFSYAELNKARVDKSCGNWISTFYSNLRTGYVKAGQKLLQLPLTNPTLRQLSVIDPVLLGHSQLEVSFIKLAKKLPASFSENDLGKLSQEVALYNVDREVKDLSAQYNSDDRVDSGYWAKVFSLKDFLGLRFPTIKKLVSGLLTIFSGPLIESTFNIMDDIVEKDRTKLTIYNYEAVAIIKTVLRKKNIKSTDLVITNKMKKDCICAYSTYQKHLKKNKEETKKAMQEKLSSSIQLLKVEKARKVAKLVKLRKRILAKERNKKRKLSLSPTRKENKWKRIRLLE